MYLFKNGRWIVLGLLMLLLTACNGTPKATPVPPMEQSEEQGQPSEVEEGMPPTVLEAGTTILRALKNGDMDVLAAWVDSDKGVRFSPYGYVNTETDLIFSKGELKVLMEDPTEHLWRSFPGLDTLIQMSYREYQERFIYDADFMGDAEIAVNEGLGQGFMVYNLNEVYPKDTHDFVEYHIEDIDPTIDSNVEVVNWRSLRLVFEKMGDNRVLVGIIHDQWTP